jgi:hypothetical protein
MAHAGQTHHNLITSPKTEGAMAHRLKEQKDSEQSVEKPYSIYTRREKWFIVMVASLAALFRCSIFICMYT